MEPTGSLITNGWLPGSWVRYSTNPITLPGGLATVDLSDGTGVLAGFVVTGPQHNQPVIELSQMWRLPSLQREGGDFHADWGPADAGGAFELDDQLQLQRMGSRVVTMVIPPTGYHQFFVFETEDLAERTNPGTGEKIPSYRSASSCRHRAGKSRSGTHRVRKEHRCPGTRPATHPACRNGSGRGTPPIPRHAPRAAHARSRHDQCHRPQPFSQCSRNRAGRRRRSSYCAGGAHALLRGSPARIRSSEPRG